jgi:hypothetical protein
VATTKRSASVAPLRARVEQYGLTVTPYERVASLIIALLILVGMAVALLFLLWLTSRIFASRMPVEVEWMEIGDGGGLGGDTELESNMEELVHEVEFEEPEFQDTLATIADAVATKAALLEDPTFTDQVGTAKGGPGGDGRSAGFGPGRPGKPRHWEVTFIEGNTSKTYARQLDFFKIELGVLQLENKVDYARNLSKDKPDKRTGIADAEKRYYLTWAKGGLREADLELLGKAGISVGEGRLIIKFIPRELEMQLMQLEKQRAGKNEKRIRATYFAIRPRGNGFEFYVRDQTYKY